MRLCLAILLLAACTDYRLNPSTDPNGEPEEDPHAGQEGYEEWGFIDGEYCNGVDDDGDGEIDEGFPDIDGDGIADCVDTECDVEIPGAMDIDIEAECTPPKAGDGDPWDITVQWRWTGVASDPTVSNVVIPPVVANLTDDNFDGRVDAEDIPDVAVLAFPEKRFEDAHLVVLDGETGREHWSLPGFHAYGGVALADLDYDGVTDIITYNRERQPVAYTADGVLMWQHPRRVSGTYPAVTVANLDGKGSVEVLADNLVLDGQTGALLFETVIPDPLVGRMPAVGDIDLDGQQEFILGQIVYGDLSGTIEWVSDVFGTYGHWTAILDIDGDPEGEVAVIGEGRLVLYDTDGSTVVDVTAGTNQPGPPCVADFDGDGVSEIAWGSSESFNAYELDGTPMWTWPMEDASGLAGCSAYDFDADGAYEVLFADEKAFYIFDGTTGALRYGNLAHASGTIFEYPVVADIDNDESAEILVGSANYRIEGWTGVTAFRQLEDGWSKSGSTWHVHDFAVTNIDADGTVPATPRRPWQAFNLYRARPTDDREFVDLVGAIVDVCSTGCTDDATVLAVVQVANIGSTTSRPRIPVALYASYEGALELLDVQVIEERVPAGQAVEGLLFELTVGELGTTGLTVRVDDDGQGGEVQWDECDEENNEGTWADRPCQ